MKNNKEVKFEISKKMFELIQKAYYMDFFSCISYTIFEELKTNYSAQSFSHIYHYYRYH